MPTSSSNSSNKTLGFQSAVQRIIDGLLASDKVQIGSFYDFVKDIWAQSYVYPEYFQAWYVQLICNDIEWCLANGKHYVCMLPRGHMKSTVLGYAFSIWRLLKAEQDAAILYMSYSYALAAYHLSEIKKHIRKNSVLEDLLIDRSPTADFSCRYMSEGKHLEILPAGLFTFKRGVHLDGGMIADDLLRDPENPLNTSQLAKVEDWFSKEAMYIPNPGAPIVVIGTPMAPGDLMSQLQEDERFFSRVLPVFNPAPDREVLAPEIRSKSWLIAEQKSNPKAFASEFMLAPYASMNAFLNDAEIEGVEDETLVSLDVYNPPYFDSDYTVAGFDIGKKRHPSHLAVFKSKAGEEGITQIVSMFLEGWDYTEQAKFLNEITNTLGIDRGYYDNTRAELEDRDLANEWVPIPFTPKMKRIMASAFERYVNEEKISLISDKRQRSQIVCVDNELKAPETPLGHGDSFWSIALGIMAHYDYGAYGTKDVGGLNDWVKETDEARARFGTFEESQEGTCPTCGERAGWLPTLQKCLICVAVQQQNNDHLAAMGIQTPILPG